MAGIRLTPEEPELPQGTPPRPQLPPAFAGAGAVLAGSGSGGGGGLEMASDDERSVAADSWSVRSEYGSTLDDDQRYADAAEVLAAAAASANFPSDTLQGYIVSCSCGVAVRTFYFVHFLVATSLMTAFRIVIKYVERGSARDVFASFVVIGQVGIGSQMRIQIDCVLTKMIKILARLKAQCWGSKVIGMLLIQKILQIFRNMGMLEKYDVMDTMAVWTKKLCIDIINGGTPSGNDSINCEVDEKQLSNYPVLDVGTGNGLLLQALAKQGFSNLTGTDYSEGAIELAKNLAARDGFTSINFLVDDILETKLDRKFKIVTDKGTLDAIGLHPDGRIKRVMYWESVSNLVEPGGIVVVTSCNHTKDELVQEVEDFSKTKSGKEHLDEGEGNVPQIFRYIDHVRTYPTIMFGGVEGSQVCTVAFQRV
uniref:Protein-lysine N-methyltransferase n=2 Tax=Oryza TaxID=4527 RepID=A0A0D3ESM1_9ORYZ